MSRANGRLGWNDQDTFDANELNTIVPYMDIYIAPSAMVAARSQPATFHAQLLMDQAAANEDAQAAWEFVTGTDSECYFSWQFKNFPIDYSDPQIRFAPQFIQIADASAPAPAEYAYMEFGVGVSYDGTTTDYTTETIEEQLQCLIPDRRVNFLAGTSGNQAALFDGLAGQGALDSTKWNFLRFEIERYGTSGNDTYGNSIYLLGVGIQFKTDFNNVAAWPS